MPANVFEFGVEMTCEACVNAVKRSLTKTYGDQLESVDADLVAKRVKVALKGEQSYEQVYQALQKCGKTVTKLQ